MVAVVQLVERQFVVLVVAGSSPVGHPIHFTARYEPLAQLVEHMTFNHGVTGSIPVWLTIQIIYGDADVAKLADALDLGSSALCVGVQVPPSAPFFLRKWLSGRASPCQGEGRGFESCLPLQKCGSIIYHIMCL